MELLLEVVIIVGVLVGVALAATGRMEPLREDEPDRVDPRIPPAGLDVSPQDVDGIRFGLALRGYRMDEVDAALDRLRDELVVLRDRLETAQRVSVPAEPLPAPPATSVAAEPPPAEPPPAEPAPEPLAGQALLWEATPAPPVESAQLPPPADPSSGDAAVARPGEPVHREGHGEPPR